MDADDLVKRLRHRADEMASGYIRPNWVGDRKLLREAADMIDEMAQRIKADEVYLKYLSSGYVRPNWVGDEKADALDQERTEAGND